MTDVVEQQGGDHLTIVLKKGAVFASAEYPHPMVTVTRDAEGDVISISSCGALADKMLALYAEWRRKTFAYPDDESLVYAMQHIEDEAGKS